VATNNPDNSLFHTIKTLIAENVARENVIDVVIKQHFSLLFYHPHYTFDDNGNIIRAMLFISRSIKSERKEVNFNKKRFSLNERQTILLAMAHC
jgi:hypothetical protein